MMLRYMDEHHEEGTTKNMKVELNGFTEAKFEAMPAAHGYTNRMENVRTRRAAEGPTRFFLAVHCVHCVQ